MILVLSVKRRISVCEVGISVAILFSHTRQPSLLPESFNATLYHTSIKSTHIQWPEDVRTQGRHAGDEAALILKRVITRVAEERVRQIRFLYVFY